ncbi:arsenate-mycothiol transferase ArsC [Phyllobacterium lublinensis]|jgi:protein-tyrosine-phosphatase|uniref:arsenate-mycothiol transferase ArsC n=1 Tax=Phyllobacterium lublinensis TaxID=2875708 RepID=UPI001CCF4A82|nr:low molecular weight phosphatase family protein [Phyllobacterium sp. 2063]MBZ9656830.1 low molecular weight phosphatase family protein [Phyllobacterium sp. 2063]
MQVEPDKSPDDQATAKTAMPSAVLFICGMNSIRSPMAETLARNLLPSTVYIASAGVEKGEPDHFVDEILEEIGLKRISAMPKTFDELEDHYFDLIITLSPKAHHMALELTRTTSVHVEYWPTPDPTLVRGRRSQILDAYRDVRDHLKRHIQERFGQTN